ncbi:MAG: S41 family peptidase [Gammaproteobacteria bacterium]|nr:S41 family peptidase [Gammaproteobacteria bacterium]MBT4493435.1 S41 family peptidase [Gammaproteobacteria bacterium]MBT7369240.1 S41 family peptidase [Gammaproteobacteria bacterium]
MKRLIFTLLLLTCWSVSADKDASTETAEEPVKPTAAEAIEVPSAPATAEVTEPELEPRLPLNELRVFAEAFNRISTAYVEEIDDRTLLENAIKGMLSQLDPHSAYLDKDSFSDLQETTTGNYGGLGIEIGMEDGFVKVIAPMDDTPAAKAGITSGDLIVQLDGTPVKGMNLSDAIDAMRGEPGSEINIMLVKTGESTPKEMTLTREIIKVASVRQKYLEDGYGYLRIAQFQSGTGEEVEKAVIRLKDEGDLEGLIIDLRNNPGGVLQSAVEVSDVFMSNGLIVYTAGRLNDSELRYNATDPDATNGVPIVVLVNEGTASASEIVAGALQDHGRAIVMGTNTFGKGSVQTILPLNNERAIKLTTARYYTPSGKSIQAEGIVPDIWVDRSKVTPVKANPWRIKEKNLAKHLTAGGKGDVETKLDGKPANLELATQDYQLNEALTLLKGLHILSRTTTPQG